MPKLKHGIVAYTFLNIKEKNHQFLSSIERDAYKRKLITFFCLTVYIGGSSPSCWEGQASYIGSEARERKWGPRRGAASPLPTNYSGWRNAVSSPSSPSAVSSPSGALAAKRFLAF